MFLELSREQKKIVEDMLNAGREKSMPQKPYEAKPAVRAVVDKVFAEKRAAMMKVESGPNKVATWKGEIPRRLKDIDIRIQEQYGDDVGDDF